MRRTTSLASFLMFFTIPVLLTYSPLMLSSPAAAPIPRTGPLTIEGTIEEISWTPETVHKAMPEMSGTLTQGRTFRARYQVVLRDISIVEESGGYGLAVDKERGKATLLLNHPADDQFLRKGMRILVSDYEESGDEGGSWSKHGSIQVIK